MRTAVFAAAALVFSAPLAAQDRDTTVVRRRAETERATRVEEAKVREEVQKALRDANRKIVEHNRETAGKIRELRIGSELRKIHEVEVDRAVRELRTQEMARPMDARLREMQPLIEARGRNLAEVRMREVEPMMAARARDLEVRARELSPLRNRIASLAMRPRLGITVALEARETDNIGAYVNGVTPGGPADKAGIRAGDIIRKIGKTSLTDRDGERRPEGESVPGLKLIEAVGKLEAGKAVEIEYRRGSRDHTTKVTPEEVEVTIAEGVGAAGTMWRRLPDGEMVARIPLPTRMDSSVRLMRSAPVARGGVAFAAPTATYTYAFTAGGPLGRIELTSLNPSLGSYFGASEGVLVINVPENDKLGLLAGDVIVSVDGRKVTSRSQLMRIVQTYEKDEELKLQIMRQKRAETVSIKLP